MTGNEAYRALISRFGSTATKILGEELVQSLFDRAKAYVDSLPAEERVRLGLDDMDYVYDNEGNMTAIPKPDGSAAYAAGNADPIAAYNSALKVKFGSLVADEMRLRGFSPINPYADVLRGVRASNIAGETMFITEAFRGIVAKQDRIVDPAQWNIAVRALHKITGKFKTTTLVLSTMWQLGDLTTSVIIAHMTGVDVQTMLRRMQQVKNEAYGPGLRTMFDPTAPQPTIGPSEQIAFASPTQDISASLAERRYQRGIPDVENQSALSKVTKAMGLNEGEGYQYPTAVRGRGVTAVSFKINETINRIARHAYFLEVLDRTLKEMGTDLDTVAADGSWRTNEKIKEAMFNAADTANKWLGDFAGLTIFERKYITPLIPFYAWIKHIHKVYYALGAEHPMSLMWYTYMGTLSYDPNEDPMGLQYGNPLAFGGVISSNFLNPLGDVAGGPVPEFLFKGNIQPAANTFGFVPRLVTAALLGKNLGKGLTDMSRPQGTYAYTESGQQKSPPLITRPGELAGYAASQWPMISRLMNIAPQMNVPGTNIALGPVQRYDTGEVRLNPRTGQPIERWGGNIAALGRLFSLPGIPYQSTDQLKEIEMAAQKRLQNIEKQKRLRALQQR
mgnify:CR=1 FL=1